MATAAPPHNNSDWGRYGTSSTVGALLGTPGGGDWALAEATPSADPRQMLVVTDRANTRTGRERNRYATAMRMMTNSTMMMTVALMTIVVPPASC
jgi:hypothetical protein